jgi:iron complex outermembrane recepter protein
MVSKRPIWTPFVEIVGQTGSFERLQGAFDVGGPVGGKDAKVAYRVTGLVRDANTQYDFQQDNKVFIAPSFTVQPTPDTTFTFLSHSRRSITRASSSTCPASARCTSIPTAGFLTTAISASRR